MFDWNSGSESGSDRENVVLDPTRQHALVRDVIKEDTLSYTQHVGEITYPNGVTERIAFDTMKRDGSTIKLGLHTGYSSESGEVYTPTKKYFRTLSGENYRTFDTVSREKRELTYRVISEVTVPTAEIDGREVLEHNVEPTRERDVSIEVEPDITGRDGVLAEAIELTPGRDRQ